MVGTLPGSELRQPWRWLRVVAASRGAWRASWFCMEWRETKVRLDELLLSTPVAAVNE